MSMVGRRLSVSTVVKCVYGGEVVKCVFGGEAVCLWQCELVWFPRKVLFTENMHNAYV